MTTPARKRFKWEPLALMLTLLGLGVWIAFAPDVPQPRPIGAQRAKLSIGPAKGVLEWTADSPPTGSRSQRSPVTFTIHYRDGTSVGPLTTQQATALLGEPQLRTITSSGTNALYRALNVTGPVGVAWVALGFIGQLAFSGRWLVQWLVSERKSSSSVPVSFWWMSLVGGAMMFAYFVWRNDVVGVLGQTSGVVIYARNIRLIAKARRKSVSIPLGESSASMQQSPSHRDN